MAVHDDSEPAAAAEPGSPERLRQVIVERLTGATGDPSRVVAAGRSCAERALPAMADGLNDKLAMPVEIEVKSVETARLGGAVPAEDTNEAIVIARSGGSPDALTMTIEPSAVAVVLDACLGGGTDPGLAAIDRPLTAIELEIASLVFEAFAKAINGHGPRSFDIKFPLSEPIAGAGLKKLSPRDGPAVCIVLSITTSAGAGLFRVLIPQRFLMETRSEAATAGANAQAERAEWRARFNGEVMRSLVSLEAVVPMAPMTLGAIARLRLGQVVELPESAQSETRLMARDRKLFTCEFGKLGQNYTVRIKQPFDAGRDFIEGLIS